MFKNLPRHQSMACSPLLHCRVQMAGSGARAHGCGSTWWTHQGLVRYVECWCGSEAQNQTAWAPWTLDSVRAVWRWMLLVIFHICSTYFLQFLNGMIGMIMFDWYDWYDWYDGHTACCDNSCAFRSCTFCSWATTLSTKLWSNRPRKLKTRTRAEMRNP